jgi:hypothetical protein
VRSVHGLGPFVTRVNFELPDGSRRVWRSRRQRKGTGVELGRPAVPARTWWIAAMFAVGSTCFAAGSLPAFTSAVGERSDAVTFFVGSIFFTTAAYLSFAEVAGTPDAIGPDSRRRIRLFSLRPHRIDWWATSVQFIGTLYFNVTTFASIYQDWSVHQAKRLVWGPDVVGSVCFLVSSWLSWAEVGDGPWSWRPRDVSWWIVALNLLGSVFFGLSAVGAKVLDDGQVRNVRLVLTGTFLGAVCFLVGSILLVPEARRRSDV